MKEEIGKKYYQFPQETVTSIPWVVHNLTLIALLMKPSTLSGSRQARLSVVTLGLKFHGQKQAQETFPILMVTGLGAPKNTHTPLGHTHL